VERDDHFFQLIDAISVGHSRGQDAVHRQEYQSVFNVFAIEQHSADSDLQRVIQRHLNLVLKRSLAGRRLQLLRRLVPHQFGSAHDSVGLVLSQHSGRYRGEGFEFLGDFFTEELAASYRIHGAQTAGNETGVLLLATRVPLSRTFQQDLPADAFNVADILRRFLL
jgi:hypothetical protein